MSLLNKISSRKSISKEIACEAVNEPQEIASEEIFVSDFVFDPILAPIHFFDSLPPVPCPHCHSSRFWVPLHSEELLCGKCSPPEFLFERKYEVEIAEDFDRKFYVKVGSKSKPKPKPMNRSPAPSKGEPSLADSSRRGVGGTGAGGDESLSDHSPQPHGSHYTFAEIRQLESGRWSPKHADAWANGRCRGMFSIYYEGLAKKELAGKEMASAGVQ